MEDLYLKPGRSRVVDRLDDEARPPSRRSRPRDTRSTTG